MMMRDGQCPSCANCWKNITALEFAGGKPHITQAQSRSVVDIHREKQLDIIIILSQLIKHYNYSTSPHPRTQLRYTLCMLPRLKLERVTQVSMIVYIEALYYFLGC